MPVFNDTEGLPYLWHLISMGLVDAQPGGDGAWTIAPNPDWKAFEGTGEGPLVAIIDNGLCKEHPNLAEENVKHRNDFTAYREGARYLPAPAEIDPDLAARAAALKTELEAGVNGMAGLDAAEKAAINDDFHAQITHLEGARVPVSAPDPSFRFASHGTACAGLVAGQVPAGNEERPDNPWAMDYLGINPYAKILPINTPYNYEYWPMTASLLWAMLHGAKVILIPRAVHDLPNRDQLVANAGERPDKTARHTRLDDPDSPEYRRLERDKMVFETILALASTSVPVIVAAGNDGTRGLQYPARLVNGKAPNLIVVGACTARGIKATYSNGTEEDVAAGNLLFAPSDDSQSVSAESLSYDRRDWRGRQINMQIARPDLPNSYTSYGVLAIDIPGVWGYSNMFDEDLEFNDEGQPDDLNHEAQHSPAALYTVFGGTSAAASLVAGMASLIQLKEAAAPLDGAGMRQRLMNNTVPGQNLLQWPPSDDPGALPLQDPVSNMVHFNAVRA